MWTAPQLPTIMPLPRDAVTGAREGPREAMALRVCALAGVLAPTAGDRPMRQMRVRARSCRPERAPGPLRDGGRPWLGSPARWRGGQGAFDLDLGFPGATQRSRPREGPASAEVMRGGVLLSREASLAVPSALRGLTSGFGMGPGVSPSLWPPQLYGNISLDGSRPYFGNRIVNASAKVIGVSQALGLLVPVS